MRKLRLFISILLICALISLSGNYSAYATSRKPAEFTLTAEERAYLDAIKGQPIEIAYSYDLAQNGTDIEPNGMLAPIISILTGEFGLSVSFRKLGWLEAFSEVEGGGVDFYGPVAIFEERRKKYITVDPFYRGHSQIVSRTSDPIRSMMGLYNRKIGLLTNSAISKTLQTYLGPNGEIVYMPTMDDMIDGLVAGVIDAFATVDNAELEILGRTGIRYEFTIENSFYDQGLISSREEMRGLSELLNRYIQENPWVRDDVSSERDHMILSNARERFSEEIAHLRKSHYVVSVYADESFYPLCYLENGVINGMQVEISKIFEDLTGIGVRFAKDAEFSDGMSTAIEKLETNECMAVIGVYYDTDTWDNPALQYSPAVWIDTIRTYSYKDIDKNLMGITVGATPFVLDYVNWNNITGNDPVTYSSHSRLTNALKIGAVDMVFMGEMAFNYCCTVLNDFNLREVGGISAEAAVHALYGAHNKEFNALFDEAISLRQSFAPKSMGTWKYQSEKYKSDHIRERNNQQMWIMAIIFIVVAMLITLIYILIRNMRAHKDTSAILKVVSAPICVADAQTGRILDVNAAFLDMCGFSDAKEYVKTSINSFIKRVDKSDVLTGPHAGRNCECIVKRLDGSVIEADIFAHPFVYQNKNAVAVHCFDLTRQKMEQQILSKAIFEAEEKRQTIISSMEYASKIQRNLLPPESAFNEAFSDYSIIWSPRDIVGGDIYWLKTFEKGSLLCVCDCTGHGTPGALLTMLVASALEAAANEQSCEDTAQLLFSVDQKLAGVLNANRDTPKAGRISDIKDGCDIAAVFIGRDGSIAFSAGNIHVFVCDGAKVRQIKGQRIYIGEGNLRSREDVRTVKIPPNPHDKFYIASDGLYDQIGGAIDRPFGYRTFEQIILCNHNESQSSISRKIWGEFEKYRSGRPRRDDVELITFMPKRR